VRGESILIQSFRSFLWALSLACRGCARRLQRTRSGKKPAPSRPGFPGCNEHYEAETTEPALSRTVRPTDAMPTWASGGRGKVASESGSRPRPSISAAARDPREIDLKTAGEQAVDESPRDGRAGAGRAAEQRGQGSEG